VSISGWVRSDSGKKMSKSIGNVVTPIDLLKNYGSDAVRHWASSARPGVDAVMDEAQLKVGRRLAIKVLNASRFCLSVLSDGPVPGPEEIETPIDLALVARLAAVVAEAGNAFAELDYARALERTESFFWSFCDDYVELVKNRAYSSDPADMPASARATLALALSVQLRLLAPILPYVTEEVWSWWHEASVHRAPWPTVDELPGAALLGTGGEPGTTGDSSVLQIAAEVLGAIRKSKTTAKRGMKAEVSTLTVTASADALALFAQADQDLRNAGNVREIVTRDGEWSVDVELAPEDDASS
jgi:valyl-tRNA synthetase